MGTRHVPIRYRTQNQMQEEKEELAIASEFDNARSIQQLGELLRDGKMKDFYDVANKYMRIKRSNPVVSKVKRDTLSGDTEIFEERQHVEGAIAEYFEAIYKRPEHMAAGGGDAEMSEE